MNPPDTNSSDRPVAYDAEGKPLYAAPQPAPMTPGTSSHVTRMPEAHDGHNFDPRMRAQYGNEPGVVHHPRAYEPKVATISDELQRKHDRSVKLYPHLNLSEGEFVILDIKRHPIGLFIPMGITILMILLLVAALVGYPTIASDVYTGDVPGLVEVTIIILCLIVIVGIGGYIAVWVYLRNTFYMTNESVIQEIQMSLFSKREQTVSLGSIEDASFRQNGILQTLLNYGTIRLSTEGEETTYRFHYVANPKAQIATLNNAIESFKNGRPVEDDDN